MRLPFLGVIATIMLLPLPAVAQNFTPGATGEVLMQPLCFALRNTAPYGVMGTITTEIYTAPDGTQARHRTNFRLDAAGGKNEDGKASDREQFCTTGPFFEGRKLELTLKTLIPIFTCKTRVDVGEIMIQGKVKPEGGTDTKALCYD